MFNISMGEIVVVLLVAVLFVGPQDLPKVARWLGKQVRKLRTLIRDIKEETGWNEVESEIKETSRELKKVAREVDVRQDLKEATDDLKKEVKGINDDLKAEGKALEKEMKTIDSEVQDAQKVVDENARVAKEEAGAFDREMKEIGKELDKPADSAKAAKPAGNQKGPRKNTKSKRR